MSLAMAGEKGNPGLPKSADGDGIAGVAKGRLHPDLLHFGQALNLIEATAAYDPDLSRVFHPFLLFLVTFIYEDKTFFSLIS